MWKSLAFLLVWLYFGSAQARAGGETWIEVRSPHFDVITDSNEKQGRHIAGQFERMRSVFHTVLPHARVDGASPIIVIAVKDRKGFQDLEPAAYLAKGQLELAGLFLAATDKNYVLLRLDSQREHPYATVYHEYTHLLINDSGVTLPLWINEGLAEFFQNTEIREKDVELGQPSRDNILFLRQNRLIPLSTFLAVDAKSPYYHEEEKGSIFYAESWAMVHFLETADQALHTHLLSDYIEQVSRHVDPVTAGERIFGDLKQFQKSLDAYVGRAEFQYFKVAAPADVNESAFTANVLSPRGANTIRADFLAYNDRGKDARDLLANVLRDEPENAAARETMGYLEFREDHLPEALRWYQEAVRLDSRSYLAHYYFAAISMQINPALHENEVEASLLAAIKLNPRFAPTYDLLAGFYGMHHEKLEEAHRLTLRAVELDSANLNYRLHAAGILQETGHYPEALTALRAAAPLAKTPEQAANLEHQIKQLEEYQAAAARTKAEEQSAPPLASPVAAPILPAAPRHPTETPTGPKHLAKGVIRHVQCTDPSTIELRVEAGTNLTSLYSNNYYKIPFTASNYTPDAELQPCTDLEGKTASVQYTATSDKSVDGQIVSVELSR